MDGANSIDKWHTDRGDFPTISDDSIEKIHRISHSLIGSMNQYHR